MFDGATLLLLVGGASVGQGAVPMVPTCQGMDGQLGAVSSAVCSVATLLVVVVPATGSVS